MWCDLRCWHPGRVPFEFRESSWLGTELMTSAGSQNTPGQRRTLGEQICDVALAFSRKCAWCIHPSHHYWVPTTHLTLWWVLGGNGWSPADVDPANKIFPRPLPPVPTPELSCLSCPVGFTSCFPFLTFQSPLHPLGATSGPTSPWKPLLLRTLEVSSLSTQGWGSFLPCVLASVLSHFGRVWLFATLWMVSHQASLPMGFSRQEYWSRLPRPSPGDLPNPGIEPTSLRIEHHPAFQAGSLPLVPPGKPSFLPTSFQCSHTKLMHHSFLKFSSLLSVTISLWFPPTFLTYNSLRNWIPSILNSLKNR